jgi:hypothetical protein
MGAPAEAALVATPGHGSGPPPNLNAQRPGTGTARAAPIDGFMLQQAQYQSAPQAMTPPATNQRSNVAKRGGGTGLIIALSIVALLLGAGAVVAYVMGTSSPPPVITEPLPTVTPLTTPTPATAPIPPAVTTTVAPLSPVAPQPVPVAPRPHPSGSAAPHPHPSGSAAPSGNVPPVSPFPPFPSSFPPIPSGFPVPSGFPTFQVPSGFPPLFPPTPNPG